jgi:phospholipase/carboxylesterase
VSARACLLALALAAACGEGEDTMPSSRRTEREWVERVAGPAAHDGAARPPLLVMLHGIGADENDLVPLAPHLDPRFRIVTLRAPRSYVIGYAWFDLEIRGDGSIRPNVTQAEGTLTELIAWLRDAPQRHDTDPQRTFLLGFSQGAIMSLGVLRTAPDLLAGVVALSGASPDGLFAPRADAGAVARVPLLIAHGTLDDVLPPEHGRRARTAFAGSENLTYREYAVGHGIGSDEIAFVARWLSTRLDAAAGPGVRRGPDPDR